MAYKVSVLHMCQWFRVRGQFLNRSRCKLRVAPADLSLGVTRRVDLRNLIVETRRAHARVRETRDRVCHREYLFVEPADTQPFRRHRRKIRTTVGNTRLTSARYRRQRPFHVHDTQICRLFHRSNWSVRTTIGEFRPNKFLLAQQRIPILWVSNRLKFNTTMLLISCGQIDIYIYITHIMRT
jgi:hypothetical protein